VKARRLRGRRYRTPSYLAWRGVGDEAFPHLVIQTAMTPPQNPRTTAKKTRKTTAFSRGLSFSETVSIAVILSKIDSAPGITFPNGSPICAVYHSRGLDLILRSGWGLTAHPAHTLVEEAGTLGEDRRLRNFENYKKGGRKPARCCIATEGEGGIAGKAQREQKKHFAANTASEQNLARKGRGSRAERNTGSKSPNAALAPVRFEP
jgi:hypothetical protein